MSFASDSFTDTAAVTLPNHTMDSGGPWVSHGSYNDNGVISNANRARNGANITTFGYYATTAPASADYDVSADLYVASKVGSMGVMGRVSTAADMMYFARYNAATSRWELYSDVAGTAASLGYYSQALTGGHTYNVRLSMVGTTIAVYIDGTSRISVTNNAVTAAGRGGIRGVDATAGGGTDSIGYHLDNFLAVNAITTSIKAVAGLADASIKTVSGVALASVGKVSGLA